MLVALTAAALAGVPEPAAVNAQGLAEAPHITVDPPCNSSGFDDVGDFTSITVRGYSFQPFVTVAMRFNGTIAEAPGNAVQVTDFGTFESTFRVFLGGSDANYLIEAVDASVVDASFTLAWTYFSVPCPSPTPSINITPDCGAPGAPVSVHIDGTGFLPGLQFLIRIVDAPTETVVYAEVGPVDLDPNAVSIDIQFTPPGVGVYNVMVGQVPPRGVEFYPPRAERAFVAPCSTLTVAPPCGPEGAPPARYPISLSGTGFQPFLGLEIIFDPVGVKQRFSWDFTVPEDGSWGPVEINPHERGQTTYEIVVRQSFGRIVTLVHETRASFTVPCPAGTITLDPPCASPQFFGDEARNFPLNVRGFGFPAGAVVAVLFDPDGLSGSTYTSEAAPATAGADGSFLVSMTVAARPVNTYRVQVSSQLTQPVFAIFSVPCGPSSPTLNVRPKCGDVDGQPKPYSIRVVGRRFIPGFVEIIFDADGTQETFSATADEANGRFERTITPTGKPAGTYRIVAQQRDVNQTPLSIASFESFRVPCASDLATLTITPSSASPGFVVQVEGTGFPEGEAVNLFWSSGIGSGAPIEVVVGDDGTFTRQVLIFAHDFTGLREMTAGTPNDPQAFDEARASLLVAPGSGSPPSYTITDAGPMDPGPIIIRR